MKRLALSLLLFSTTVAQSQVIETAKRIGFYDTDNKKITMETFNLIMKKNHESMFVRRKDHGSDSVSFTLTKYTLSQIKEDSLAAVKRDNDLQNLINSKLPPIVLKTVSGDSISIASIKGIKVLHFWFTACQPCLDEIPAMNRLIKKYSKLNVNFIGLTYESSDQVKKFMLKNKFDLPTYVDAAQTIEKLKITSYPTTMLTDEYNKILFIDNKGISATRALELYLSQLVIR
ncbi:peroxiredoxin family protein [Pedobacter sp. GR22-6]|uniref:peroxiredoxin family protein n=1 Tax=Pedobacter sp. GR22-6 TaxID=3127957 RepID=UPI00307EDCAA